jgi:hypothetical protein
MSFEDALQDILRGIEHENSVTIQDDTIMPLQDRDILSAVKVIEGNVNLMIAGGKKKRYYNFLVSGGAPGIGNLMCYDVFVHFSVIYS